MQKSIKSIFNNLSLFLILTTIFVGFGAFVALEYNKGYEKIDNLNQQKQIISQLINLKIDDKEIMMIQFNGKSTQLLNSIQKLKNQYKYNYIEQYIINNSNEYLSDLKELTALTKDFNQKARNHYINNQTNTKIKQQDIEKSYLSLNNQINKILFKSIEYNKAKFNIHKNITFIAFIIIFLITITFRKKLNMIYKDLDFLHNMEHKEYKIQTQEADAIFFRMNKKVLTSDNPSMIDPVTGINNHKGMISSYNEKKAMKESDFTSVTIIEVDNFSRTNRVYSQEFTQNILKKIAFTISLHEHSTDTIARIDYNQFAIILSRASKEIAFKDIDIIRENISEIRFKSAQTGSVVVTVSGGYINKANNISLEEAIKDTKKVLHHAQEHGGNRISQIRNLQESDYAQ